jgi:hypothetical protein
MYDLAEGVSDWLKMERGSSSATYVASGKLHPIKYQTTDKLFSSLVRILNIS